MVAAVLQMGSIYAAARALGTSKHKQRLVAMDLRCVNPCKPLCPTCNQAAQQHRASASKWPPDCLRTAMEKHLHGLSNAVGQPTCVLAAGCGWRTQSSSRCRWHCSRRGSACAAATQGAVPDTRHSICGFKALCAGLITWLPTNRVALCIGPRSAQHGLTLHARHCSRLAGGCVQGVAVLCGLGPFRAEHTAAGGYSGIAHRRHPGLRVAGPQRPALCARPQGCPPCCSSCTLKSVQLLHTLERINQCDAKW